MDCIKIALVSLNQAWKDKKANVKKCEKYMQIGAKNLADLVIFPEMTFTGFTNDTNLAEFIDKSPILNDISNLARMHNIALICGFMQNQDDKFYNTAIFIDKNGNLIEKYAKIHLFSFAREDQYFEAGNKLSVVNFCNHRIGLSICYDLRFAEIYSAYQSRCDIIVNIANWSKQRVDHWNALLKARAIENQLFIVGVNRTGIDGNSLEYTQSSNIFNANGEILDYKAVDEMKIYNISKTWTQNFKAKFNTTNDKKNELYERLKKC